MQTSIKKDCLKQYDKAFENMNPDPFKHSIRMAKFEGFGETKNRVNITYLRGKLKDKGVFTVENKKTMPLKIKSIEPIASKRTYSYNKIVHMAWTSRSTLALMSKSSS